VNMTYFTICIERRIAQFDSCCTCVLPVHHTIGIFEMCTIQPTNQPTMSRRTSLHKLLGWKTYLLRTHCDGLKDPASPFVTIPVGGLLKSAPMMIFSMAGCSSSPNTLTLCNFQPASLMPRSSNGENDSPLFNSHCEKSNSTIFRFSK